MATKNWRGTTNTTYTTATNWLGGVAPIDGDDVVIDREATNNIDGIDETGTELNSFAVEAGATITIGSAAAFLQIDFTGQTAKTLRYLADDSGSAPGAAYIDVDAAAQIVVMVAPNAVSTTTYGLTLLGQSNTRIDIDHGTSGSVAIAPDGTAVQFDTINVYSGDLTLGAAVAKAAGGGPDVNIYDGAVESDSALATLYQYGGTLTQQAGAITTAYVEGGTLVYNSTGTITTAEVRGTLDLSGDTRALTITTLKLYAGGSFLDPNRRATLTNQIQLIRCGLEDVTIDLGENFKITPVAL